MLGGSGVGKTCFLAGLALLNEQSDGRNFVLPKDDATKAVFESLRETLSKGRWPAKTSIVDTLFFTVVRGKNRVEVELSDFAGESFSDAMKRGNANEAASHVQSLVSNADLLLVLLDGASVDRDSDFTGGPLIQAVFERIGAQANADLDVTVVLTKSDLCVNTPMHSGDDLKQLVETRAADLYRFLSEQGIRTEWVLASVCGQNATDAAGLPIYAALAPQGYETLFGQLFRRGARQRNRRLQLIGATIVFAVVMAIGWTILRGKNVSDQAHRIQDQTRPIVEMLENIFPENQAIFRQRYVEDIEKEKKEIESSGNIESISRVLKRFERIPSDHGPFVSKEVEGLFSQANVRKEQLLHKAVVDCQQLGTGDFVPLVGKYLSEFPDGPNADAHRKMLKDLNQARYMTARGQVKTVPVSSTEALRQKITAITTFLSDHGQSLSPEEKISITVARDAASEFVVSRQYHCKLIRTSGMDGPRDHGVVIYVNGELIANYEDSGDVSECNWNREFTINWQSGKDIKVILRNFEGFNHDMAYFENNTPIAIVLLTEENVPCRYSTGISVSQDFTKTRPPFKIKFECKEVVPEKLQDILDYVSPGDKW